jgi:hypothetical protein
MSRSLKKLLILLLCLWLPAPVGIASLLPCHMANKSDHVQLKPVEHSGCDSHQKMKLAEKPQIKVQDSASQATCDHCQTTCQPAQGLVVALVVSRALLVHPAHIPYVSPLHSFPFLEQPQRPPQAA